MVEFADLPKDQYALLGAAPTQVSLPPGLIDALIAGGKQAVRENASVRALSAN